MNWLEWFLERVEEFDEFESIGVGASVAKATEATKILPSRSPRISTLEILDLFNKL